VRPSDDRERSRRAGKSFGTHSSTRRLGAAFGASEITERGRRFPRPTPSLRLVGSQSLPRRFDDAARARPLTRPSVSAAESRPNLDHGPDRDSGEQEDQQGDGQRRERIAGDGQVTATAAGRRVAGGWPDPRSGHVRCQAGTGPIAGAGAALSTAAAFGTRVVLVDHALGKGGGGDCQRRRQQRGKHADGEGDASRVPSVLIGERVQEAIAIPSFLKATPAAQVDRLCADSRLR